MFTVFNPISNILTDVKWHEVVLHVAQGVDPLPLQCWASAIDISTKNNGIIFVPGK